jgi:predicted alpha/beta hydrolase
MDIKHLYIPVADGFRIAATMYKNENEGANVNRVVLINSAAAVKRGFYEAYALFLVEQGFCAVTFDYRGIGNSRPASLKEFSASMREWGEKDISGMINWIGSELNPAKLLVVAHSVGGQLVALANNNCRIDAMLTVGAQNGYWKLYDPPKRYQQYISARFIVPMLTWICGYLPMKRLGRGEDMPKGVALEWASWCLNRRYMFGDHSLCSLENIRSFKGPIFAYSIEGDAWAPSHAVDQLMRFYAGAQITRRHVRLSEVGAPSIGHFGFFRTMFRSTLWRETAEWLRQR